jgi:hypothetical protein
MHPRKNKMSIPGSNFDYSCSSNIHSYKASAPPHHHHPPSRICPSFATVVCAYVVLQRWKNGLWEDCISVIDVLFKQRCCLCRLIACAFLHPTSMSVSAGSWWSSLTPLWLHFIPRAHVLSSNPWPKRYCIMIQCYGLFLTCGLYIYPRWGILFP